MVSDKTKFQSKSSHVVVVGSLNADLVVSTPRLPNPGETITGLSVNNYCGGKGANQACAAARAGANVIMIGQVGSDPFGEKLFRNLEMEGVDTSLVSVLPQHPTGTALIEVEPGGQNRIIVIPGANGIPCPKLIIQSAPIIHNASCLLLQMEVAPETNASIIEQMSLTSSTILILDPAPASPISNEWLKKINYLTPNQTELNVLTGRSISEDASIDQIAEGAKLLCARGARCVIVKLGSRGALKVTSNDIYHCPAPKVNPVDTTAAGDCFNGVFAAALTLKHSTHSAIHHAVKAASISVTRQGAQPSMPKAAELLPH